MPALGAVCHTADMIINCIVYMHIVLILRKQEMNMIVFSKPALGATFTHTRDENDCICNGCIGVDYKRTARIGAQFQNKHDI